MIQKILTTPTHFGRFERLPIGLAVMRLFLAAYLLQWAWLSLVYPLAAADVWERWYGINVPLGASQGFGLVLAGLGVAMAIGLWSRVTYWLSAAIVLTGVLGLLPHLLNPFGFHRPPNWINHGLIAQLPVAMGFVALALARKADVLSLQSLWQRRSIGSESPALQIPVGDRAVALGLLLIRLSVALFFFQWGIEKFIKLEMASGTLERWYGVSSYVEVVTMALGAFEIALALAIALGLWRRLSYGIAILIKLRTIWAIAALLFIPFANETGGRLSTVGPSLPLLGVLLYLYFVRAWDSFGVAD